MASNDQNHSSVMTSRPDPHSAGAEASQIQFLEDAANTLIGEFQGKLQQTLHLFKLKAAKQVAGEFPRITSKLLDRASADLEKLATETGEKIREAQRAAQPEFAEESRKLLAAQSQDSLNLFVNEAKEAARGVLGEMTQSIEEQSQSVSHKVDAGLQSVHTAAEETAAQLRAAWSQTESSLLETHQRLQGQLDASIAKELAQKAKTALDSFEAEIERTLAACRRQAADRIEEDLAKAATALLERSTVQLQSQTDGVRKTLLAELRNSGNNVLEDARRQLAGLEKSSSNVLIHCAEAAAEKAVAQVARGFEEQGREAILHSTEAALARIEGERQKLQAQAGASLADHQKQLLQMSFQSIEGVQRKLDSHLEAFRGQLQVSVQTFEQRAIEKATDKFPSLAAGLLEGPSAVIRKTASEAAEQVRGEIQASCSAFGEEIRRQALQESEGPLRRMHESTLDQAREQLRQLTKNAASAHLKEFEKHIEESLRKQRRSAQNQMDELARSALHRVQQTAAQNASESTRGSSPSTLLLAVVAIIPAALVLLILGRPVMRLKPNPPATFLNAYPSWKAKHSDLAVQMGAAYWDWAALHLQPDYPYGSHLPKQPLPAFEVEGSGFPRGVDADVARLRYWQKLRELWNNPQAWNKIEPWDRR